MPEAELLKTSRVVSLAFVDVKDVDDETESVMKALVMAREKLREADRAIQSLADQLGLWEQDVGPRLDRLRRCDSRLSVLAETVRP
jgi:hypothetical protein